MKGKIKYLMIIVAIIVSMAIMIPSANGNLSLFANNNSMSADISGEKTPDLYSATDSGLSSSGLSAQNLVSGDSHNHASLLSGETRAATSGAHVDCAGGHSGWTAIAMAGGALSAGNYVLNDDVNLTTNLTIIANATVNLCLNGFKLTGNGSGSVITVASGGTLNLHDCQADSLIDKPEHAYYIDSTGKFVYDFTTAPEGATQGTTYAGVITGGSTAKGGGIINSGTLNMTGGTIAGNTANGNGGGVHSSETFNMTGGNIFGNTAISGVGGGVYVHAGTFNMSDPDNKVPIISQNKASSSGGGVYVYLNSTFTMSGGTISENSTTHGAGIYFNGTSFEMSGGTISGNIASGNGGGVALAGGISSISNTAQISGNKAASGGGIRIDGSTFTMSGGTISGNEATNNGGLGGGVSVSYYPNNSSRPGSFTMSGGTISGNNATTSGLGGGVHVNTNCSFTMSGGTIGGTGTSDANTATNGGGVYSNGTTFVMKNGTNNEIPNISGNTATADGGGVIVFSGTFTMSGGAISNNTATADAGGVLISADTTFTMSGGTIGGTETTNANTATNGGGVYIYEGTFTMSGGEISSNNATSGGGGVYVHGLAVDGSPKISNFTMSDTAKILNNTAAASGGGVNLFGYNATFTMNGGEISSNNSGGEGGGVYVYEKSFSMNGGTISSNKAPSGGGVYIHSSANSVFNISGTPKITGNTLINGTTNNNVHLSTGKAITVTGPLTTGASIGISPNSARVFTSGYGTNHTTTGTVTPPTFFTLDDNSNGTIGIKLNTTGEAEIAAKYTLTFDANEGSHPSTGGPTHDPLFKGDALTAIDEAKLPTRADNIFMGYFDAQTGGTKYFNANGTVSTEGGTPKTFNKTENTTFYAQWKIDIVTVTDFEVKKADGKAPIYKGSAFIPVDLSVTSAIAGTNFSFEMVTDETVLESGTTVDNKNASISGQTTGNKTARIKIIGTGEYTGTTYFNFTIGKATLTVTPNANQTKVYGTPDQALTYAHSGAENNETPNFEGALSRVAGENVGTYAITEGTLTLVDGTVANTFKASNYTLKFSETVVNFSITAKPLADNMLENFVDKTYNGAEQKPTVTVTDSAATITAADYTLAWEYKDAVGGAYSSVTAPEFKNAGTYKVTITAKADGNYSGSASKEYVIGQKAATIAGTSETIIKVVNGVASASPDLIEAKHYTLTGVNGESLSVNITSVEFASASVESDIVVTVTAELDSTNAVNENYTFGTPTTTFTIKGEIVNSNADEGTETSGDYFVTSSDSTFFTNAMGKKFTKGDLTIEISTSSNYTAIGLTAEGEATSLIITNTAQTISAYMLNKESNAWEYVFINYAVDKANPTIGDMTITNEVGEELTNWFNNDSVKVIIDGVSDENSQVSWTDDVNAMTLEKIETSGESTTQTPIDFEKDATTGKISFALNYTDTATINGAYRLTVYDNVGNESYKDFKINKHDNVAPTIADNTTADTWLGATTVAYTIQDGESAHPSAVLSTVVKVNGKTISDFAGSLTFNASGIYSVEITATDNAGNTATYKESIHIDTLIDELKTLYGEFDAAGADAAKDAAAIAFENKWKSLTDTQKSHATFVENPANGVINGNKEVSDFNNTINTYIEGRKDEVNSAEADAIISGLADGLAGTLTEDDLRDLIANYERADDAVKKLIDEDRSTAPTAKENIENGKIVLPLMNTLNAKPNNNDQLNAWIETWGDLTAEQKALANKFDSTLTARAGHYETYKTEIDALISGVNAITKLTAENKVAVSGLIEKYDTMKDKNASLETTPVVTQQDLVPLNVVAKLEGWDKIIKKTEAVKDLITAITADITTDNFEAGYSEYLKAKEEFDALTKDEQGLVPNSADLTAKGGAYNSYIANLEESEKKAAEDRKKANEVIRAIDKLSYGTVTPYVAGSTVHDIIATQKMYDELTDEQKAIVDANAAKAKLDEFTRVRKEVFANGEETPAEIINDIIAIDLTSATRDELDALINDYDNTSDNGKLLIKNTISEKLDELTDLIARLKKAEEEIGKIPTGSQNEHECSLCNPGTSDGTAHNTTKHIESIEDAKIAFEKLTESEKGLLTPGLKTRIETEYEKLKTLLEAQTQKLIVYDKAENVDVSVIGLNSKVNTSKVPNIATAAEVTIYVDAKKTNNVLTDLPDTMKNVASFDVKLMAKAGDDKATEIQPTLGKKVLVKLPVGANIDRGAAKVYHIKANGSRAIVEKVSFISEGNNMYAVFEIDSFSEFIVVDEKKATPPSGGGGGSSISKVDLFWANVRNELELKDTNPVVIDLREEKLTSVPKHILEAQKESDKALTLKFAEGDIAITNKMAKGTEYLKDSYTYADLSAMFERAPIEPTPTPTPTPTPEPTEENTVWQLSLAIVLILLATICVIAVITRKRRKH